ncbi:hypothetical protein BOVA604_4977 [Bacteroides ovatus]|nr:hypothetical protein BOVA604_4977 [Bacteroides ovatus]
MNRNANVIAGHISCPAITFALELFYKESQVSLLKGIYIK